ncbi:MAG: NF038122 family metalloprotease [Xenococcaceae cyanobacterium MO_167.B52]|nr:NF038122 family metalloprotease [Xenococcaceae cyanobacterium MO_167.B52]
MNTLNSGVDFNFTFAPEVTDDQILGFELAGEMWSQSLVDTYNSKNLEINIHVEIRDDLLPDHIIGGAFPTIETGLHYKDFYSAIQDDVTTATDQTIADSLLNQKKIELLVGENIIDKNFKMHATRANMKALGLVAGDSEQLDAYIVINPLNNVDAVSWDYNYLGDVQEGTLDFLSVAQHEIGHALGFISGIDYQGWNQKVNGNENKALTHMTSMDIFRYSIASAGVGINDLSVGKEAFFSIDGTVNNALAMSTGADYQGSHWIDRTQQDGLGIMNPTLGLKERWSISNNDLLAMDAMGWDVVYPAETNLQALYDTALSQVKTAVIADRIKEVDGILDVEAYNWARRSSSVGFWWARRSSSVSFWQVGYWSTYESATTTTENSADFNWQNSEYSEILSTISNVITSFLANIDWDDFDWGDLDGSNHSSGDSSSDGDDSSWGNHSWSNYSWGDNGDNDNDDDEDDDD